jgi:aspartyl protease family protein
LQRRPWEWAAAGLLLLLPELSLATDVHVVAVTPGRSADLVIDGAPVTLEVGEQTAEGVKLLSADRDRAVVRVDGKTKTLSLVAARPGGAGGGGGGSGGSSTVVLSTDGGGHFTTRCHINGRPVPCLVDTGATETTLSTASADGIGLDYEDGIPTQAMTVNGMVAGWRVSLDSVRIGDVNVRGVDAIVVDNDSLPVVLLGMSFLGRFDMHRQGSTLTLRRRR